MYSLIRKIILVIIHNIFGIFVISVSAVYYFYEIFHLGIHYSFDDLTDLNSSWKCEAFSREYFLFILTSVKLGESGVFE